MGWRAVLQGIEQKAKFELGFFGGDLQCVKHLLLHVRAMNAHRTATNFPAIEHHVIALGNAFLGCRDHPVLVPVFGRGEGVVHRRVALGFFVKLEHREVHHPQRGPAVFEQTILFGHVAVAHLQAQGAHGVVDHLGLVGTKEQHIAVLGAGALQNFGNGFVVQVFHDGRLQAVAPRADIVDLDPGQALGAINFHKLGVAVDLATADVATPWNAQSHHTPTFAGGRGAEHFEVHIAHDIGEFGQAELDTQVGLVGAIQMHGVLVGHHRKLTQVDAQGVFEHASDHVLEQGANFFFGQKRSFDIDLGEFGLTVGAQIFVAEALGDLVVTVIPRHHEQLLEQLGRLGQRKKLTVVHPAGHQVVARAFRRALGEHGGFDVDKTMGVQKLANLHRHFVAQHEVFLHVGAAQIEHAVGQAGGLGEVVVIQLKGRCDRGVEHRQFVAQHLDLAAFEAIVGRALRAGTHQAFDLDAKLVAQVFGDGKHLGAIGVAHHLHIAFAVAQVDKDHTPVIAAAVDPAAQRNGLPCQGFGHQTAVVGTHGHT